MKWQSLAWTVLAMMLAPLASRASEETSRSAGVRSVSSFVSPVYYTVTDLGTVPGGSGSDAQGINASGQVVGASMVPPGHDRAYLWSGGVMTDLGTLGGDTAAAHDINDFGQVVGVAATRQQALHAFLWSGGVMRDLGTIPGGSGGDWSEALSINARGQVVGYSTGSGGYYHAFLWSNGVMTDLGSLGYSHTVANDINASGQIVGWSGTANGYSHAILWNKGILTDLDGIPSRSSEAMAINDHGHIVGDAGAGSTFRAFLWSNGTMTSLGALPGCDVSYASDINNSDQVVGWSRTSSDVEVAFLWSAGTMTDLSSAIAPGSGWQLQRAVGINDAGQIAGYGRLGGSTHAFLLTPIPEPSSLFLLGVASLSLLLPIACGRRAMNNAVRGG
jgi:probable HAF family extracellular repeat protein